MNGIDLTIKEEYKSIVVGFGNNGLPLGERTQDELIKLAEMAAYDGYSAKYFTNLPTPEQIATYKENKFLAAYPAPEKPAETVTAPVVVTSEQTDTPPEENHE